MRVLESRREPPGDLEFAPNFRTSTCHVTRTVLETPPLDLPQSVAVIRLGDLY
jgi:hypothetical protein